jgi:cytochrome c-type biogenesis protein CcmH
MLRAAYSTTALLAAALAALLLMLASPVRATEAGEMLADPALEARARAITAGLRCVVCQNQSVDESNAPLARDLRRLVRERITAGDTDDQVIAYVVARYGEFALLKPRFAVHTLVLWLAPLAILLAAIAYAMMRMRARSPAGAAPSAPLSEEQERRLAELMADGRDDGHDGPADATSSTSLPKS